MPNEVEVTVKSKDKSDYAGIKRNAKGEFSKAGDEAGKSFSESAGKSSSKTREKFSKEGDESGRKFGASIKKWFAGDGGGLFTEIGKSGGTVFGSGLLGALKTPVLGPAITAVFAATVATVLPAVGAIGAGAFVTGFGAGLAGLGIVFAAKNDEVKKKWSETLSQLGGDMQLLARPFEGTLINIAGYFKRTVDKFNPTLATAFAKMAGPVDSFVDETSRSLEQLVPAIDPITEAFDEVLDSLGPALSSAIGDISAGMIDLANSVKENPEALADTVEGIGDIVRSGLDLLTRLNEINGKFSDLTGGLSLVDVVLQGVRNTIDLVTGTFAPLAGVLTGVNALIGRTGKDSADAGKSMSDAANSVAKLAQEHGALGSEAQHAAPKVQTVAEKVAEAKKQAAEAKQKFEDFISSLFKLQNQSLSLSGAQIGLQAAIDDATKSIKDNGRTYDINTEKGRANKTALDNVASAANAQTEAMIRAGRGTASAAKTAEASKANFVSLAQKMGYSKSEAEALARKMVAIPNVSREAKLKADKTDLDAKLKAAKEKLKDKSLTATKKAKLTAEIAALQRAVNNAQTKINSLKGKTVYANLVYTTSLKGGRLGQDPEGKRQSGGFVRGYAAGTPAARNTFLVGEDGPEFLTMSGGQGRVTPAANTRRSLADMAGAAQKIVLELVAGDSSRYTQFLITELRKAIQVKGGNVQVVLGS